MNIIFQSELQNSIKNIRSEIFYAVWDRLETDDIYIINETDYNPMYIIGNQKSIDAIQSNLLKPLRHIKECVNPKSYLVRMRPILE